MKIFRKGGLSPLEIVGCCIIGVGISWYTWKPILEDMQRQRLEDEMERKQKNAEKKSETE